ncbi:urate oxidase [Streptomyces griseoviridis]|uniref:Uricase n=1 Tax=Streptomyces griseoviridis TaxID=45398 RepID=A0A3S9Z8L7_STRGD|nr:urate oxidase [Streptomyces griseoviridis]AZS84126.1 urate oxidase [Streptomyces griseoviridis]QCN89022.1 urate oxidase [Streptomyces griseoviridis]
MTDVARPAHADVPHPARTEPARQARLVTLGQNQYGKAENRVVRITRDGATHHIKDLNVSVALSGDMDEVHLSGSNANVLPTDTTKNTVFAFAKEHGVASAEQFGIHLARHFVTSQESIHSARIRVEEYSWERIAAPGADAPADAPRHSFVRSGQETRLTQITYDGTSWEVVSGLKDLTVLNSTDSEFWGYVKDKYTTLPEAYDRILATEVSGRWRFAWSDDEREMPDWEESYRQVRAHLLQAFAETYSLSLQQTLYEMGSRIIEHRAEIDEVRFSLPNKHHFLVDLEPFGLKNDNEVYLAADRPYGLIEATVLRDGCEPRIPVDLSNL